MFDQGGFARYPGFDGVGERLACNRRSAPARDDIASLFMKMWDMRRDNQDERAATIWMVI